MFSTAQDRDYFLFLDNPGLGDEFRTLVNNTSTRNNRSWKDFKNERIQINPKYIKAFEKKKLSWSKPLSVKNLIGRKQVDWNIFSNGTNIPLEFHSEFDAANRKPLIRGTKKAIQLLHNGITYSAFIQNMDRTNITTNTYQIRYDSNEDLLSLFSTLFETSHDYILSTRENAGKDKKQYIKIPDDKAEFIDFLDTGVPFKYEIDLHPISKQVTNYDNLDDIEFQRSVLTTTITDSIEIKDTPLPKPSKQSNSAGPKYKRDSLTAKKALLQAGFACEVDSTHRDFVSKITGKNYVEAHHLVPIEYQDQFNFSIDVESNIVSVCATCHKKLHHAIFKEIKPVLDVLFKKRQERLQNSGIIVTVDQMYSLYK